MAAVAIINPSTRARCAQHNFLKLLKLYLSDHPDYTAMQEEALRIDVTNDGAFDAILLLKKRMYRLRNQKWISALLTELTQGRKPNARMQAFIKKVKATDVTQPDFVWVMTALKNERDNILYDADLITDPLTLKRRDFEKLAKPKTRGRRNA